MSLPHDPFGRSATPAGFTREDRVKLIAEAAEALLADRLPHPVARFFLGAALAAWLREGGRLGALERDFLRVTGKERSRLTPARLLARCARTATADDAGGTVSTSLYGEPEHDPDD